nr:hypothetical protein X990_4416 [Burkholderia pseudomallei MSHR4868]
MADKERSFDPIESTREIFVARRLDSSWICG